MDSKRKIDELPLEIIVANTLEHTATEVQKLREFLAEILARVVARQSVNSKVFFLI